MKLGFAELRRTRARFAAISGAVAFIERKSQWPDRPSC